MSDKQYRTYWEKLQDSRWQEKRLRVMEKSGEGGFTCIWCGAGKGSGVTLHVDHAYYKRGADPWEYDEDTLWCLCSACHAEAGRVREDVHRVIARMHPAFLRQLGMQVSEIEQRLEPLRRVARPRWGPVFCRRCGKEIGRLEGVSMTIPTAGGPRTFDDIYQLQLFPESRETGRCQHCGLEIEFENSPCTDSYLPSLASHTQE